MKIDDVCAVFPVHGSAGVIGVLALPFVSASTASRSTCSSRRVIGVVVITAWTIVATAVVFGAFKALGQARVTSNTSATGSTSASTASRRTRVR